MWGLMHTLSRLLLILLLLPVSFFASAEGIKQQQLTLVFASNMPEIGPANRGSYPKLASLLEKTRQEDELSLFVFGGSSLGPSTLSSLDRGSHIIDILNTLEPDLMNIGKREFSYFEDELSLRSYEAAFPFISSNLYDPLTKSNLEGINTNIIIEKGDLRVGFITLLNDDTVQEYLLQRVKTLAPQDVVGQQIKQLEQQGADLIVLIYSQDNPYYQTLLDSQAVDFALRIAPSADYLNDDNPLPSDKRFTLSDKKTTLVLKLSWPHNTPKALTIEEVNLDLNSYPSHAATAILIDEYNKRLNRLLNQPIGTLTRAMNSQRRLIRTGENAFGNFIADALKEATGSEVAIVNSGSIRGDRDYSANTVLTRGDIIRELPFRTNLSVVSVSGEQLWAVLEHSVSQVATAGGRFLQVSGIRFTYNSTEPVGKRISTVSINGKPLNMSRQYSLASSDYLIQGGDGFTTFAQAQSLMAASQDTPILSDIVIRAIQKQRTITPQLESRIVKVDP